MSVVYTVILRLINTTLCEKMILSKWAEGAVVVAEEEPVLEAAGEGAVDRAEAGYVQMSLITVCASTFSYIF